MSNRNRHNLYKYCGVTASAICALMLQVAAAENDDEPVPAELAEKSVPELFAMSTHWSPVTRVHVTRALADHGKEVLPGALQLLTAASPFARRAGTDIITEMCSPKTAARLHPDVKKNAAVEETRKELSTAVAQLIPLLSDTNMWVRCGAAEALAALGPESKSAAPALFKAMSDPDNWVIERAATALAAAGVEGIDRKALLPQLLAALKSPRSRTRSAAVKMLDTLGEDARAAIPQLLESVQNRSTDSMFSDGPRIDACQLLARLKAPESVAACIILLEEERWGAAFRISRAISILATMGPAAADAIPALEKIAADGRTPDLQRDVKKTIAAIRGENK